MSAIVGLATNRIECSISPRPVEPKAESAFLIWFASIGGSLALAALFAAHQGTLLRIAVPAVATAIAAALYFRRPIGYIHFTLWTWFVTPLIRRVIDWRFGYEDQNLVLLAPFLVTAIAGLTVLREGRNARGLQLTPYLLCAAGILYGFLVGIIRWELHSSAAESLGSIVYGLLLWLAPLLFGLHLHLGWRSYEAQKSAILNSFKWGVFILGVYGIYQYIAAPQWDCAWLDGVMVGDVNTSFGRPSPYEIRVWSTSNSPGAFASIMLAGLVLLIGMKSRFKLACAGAGYLSFLLCQVRTAWLAWVLSIAVMAITSRGPTLRRFLLSLFLLPICLAPLMFNPQIQQAVQDRFVTMQDVGHDESFEDRTAMYRLVTLELLHEPAGRGLLNNNISVDEMALDSGLLQTFLMLGMIGAALFTAGILIAIFSMGGWKKSARANELSPERIAYRAIFIAVLAESVGGNVFVSITGLIFWACFALWASAIQMETEEQRSFHRYTRAASC